MNNNIEVSIKSDHRADCRYHGQGKVLGCACPKTVFWSEGRRDRNGKVVMERVRFKTLAEAEERMRAEQLRLNGGQPQPVAVAPPVALPVAAPAAAPANKNAKTATLEEATQFFLAYKKDSTNRQTDEPISERHIGKLTWLLDGFQAFAKEQGLATVADVRPAHIMTWRTQLKQKQRKGEEYSRSYKAKLLVYLTEFFDYCVGMEFISSTPMTKPTKRGAHAPKAQEPKALSDAQLDQLFAAIPKLRGNGITKLLPALLLLMRWTGLAIRDALILKRSAIMENGGGFWKVDTARSKTGKPVYCTLRAEIAQKILAGALPAGKHLFLASVPTEEKELNLLVGNWGKLVSKLGRLADIKDEEGNKLEPTSHWLRHSFARWCFDHEMPTEDVAALLGDNVETVAAHYSTWIHARQERLTERMKQALAQAQAATAGN